jgi:outer membrane protein assembly factor BamB
VKPSRFLHFSLAICLGSLIAIDFVRADNWPQWRGPNGDGISQETHVPTRWSATENVAWKLPLPGMGGSTPIVWGDRIFLTSEDGNDLVLLCIDTTGKELWKRKLGSGRYRARSDEGNLASATPSTDGKHVYAFVGSGDFACFTLDGKEVWKFNAQERYGKFRIQFGMHSTPVLFGERLYMQLLYTGAAWVIALDKNTGETVWKVKRESDGRAECEHSYASPVIWHKGDKAYLITHGNDYAIAHRLDNGAEIWRVGDLNPKNRYNTTLRFVASPVASADLIVVPSAKNGPVVGVKPSATGTFGVGSSQEQWRLPKNTPDVPSPLVHDGLVYLCRENGVLMCLDAKTGQQHYAESLPKQRYRASPVYADGKIYLTGRDGVISVVKAGPKFELLATNRMGDAMSASPAISGGRIYLRGFSTLFAIETGK